MRIISGKFRGRIIQAPGNLPVRPTTDYAKSGLFNILANHIAFESISVLDLFCGIGSIGFEFASRGAKQVLCVDEHAACLKFIREVCGRLAIQNISTLKSDSFDLIRSTDRQFDVIFADPPFEDEGTDRLPDLIFEKKLLAENGWLIVEHQSKRELKSNARPIQVRKYGNCAFSFYR